MCQALVVGRRRGETPKSSEQSSPRLDAYKPRIGNEEMMSKEYLINEAHQLDHQTTILNKLDVRIGCEEEEEKHQEIRFTFKLDLFELHTLTTIYM